ncbi:IS240-type transposase (ISH102) [Halorubrum sp. AJ67]|nr:IS240-type transposase (ISH102) [Halorubrum sp. AJ67]
MKLSIQLHLSVLSISNIIFCFLKYSVLIEVDRPFITGPQANLQSETDRNPNPVVVDETVIRLNNEQYRLYAAVDTDSNDLIYTLFEPTKTNIILDQFFSELHKKYD